MLTQPLVEQLKSLRCSGMAEALREQLQTPEAASLSFEERLAFLIERELLLREQACIETLIIKPPVAYQKCKSINLLYVIG